MQDLRVKLLAILSAADPKTIGKNGRALLEADPMDWVFDCNVLQLMAPDAREDPIHFDGGGSLLFMALTLWGKRETSLLVGSAAAGKAVTSATGKAARKTFPKAVVSGAGKAKKKVRSRRLSVIQSQTQRKKVGARAKPKARPSAKADGKEKPKKQVFSARNAHAPVCYASILYLLFSVCH